MPDHFDPSKRAVGWAGFDRCQGWAPKRAYLGAIWGLTLRAVSDTKTPLCCREGQRRAAEASFSGERSAGRAGWRPVLMPVIRESEMCLGNGGGVLREVGNSDN